jgi:hypothetical protein
MLFEGPSSPDTYLLEYVPHSAYMEIWRKTSARLKARYQAVFVEIEHFLPASEVFFINSDFMSGVLIVRLSFDLTKTVAFFVDVWS